MSSIKLILRLDKLDQTGVAPLYMRIIKDRKSKFISLGLKFKPNEWDENKQIVKKNHSNSQRMNAFITEKISEAQGQVADMSRGKKEVTAKKLKEAIMGKAPGNYFEYVYGRLAKLKDSMNYSVWALNLSKTKKLEAFVGSKDLLFQDITLSFLQDFKAWMINHRKNNPNTVAGTFRLMQKYTKEAINDGVATPSNFPYNKTLTTSPAPERYFLTKVQIEALKNIQYSDNTKAKIYRDMFLFCCFAGGLRFSDVLELRWENYVEEERRIIKTMRKSGRTHNFKIGTVSQEILKIYKRADSENSDYIFPLLNKYMHYEGNGKEHYSIKSNISGNANMYLRQMGKEIGLPFRLTFHASRHTFATYALNNGMPIEYVSKLMDHTSIGSTQIYAKIINKNLDNAVEQYID